MRKKDTKLKKYESRGNETEKCSVWYIGKATRTNMINRLQKQGYLMQKELLKTIGQGIQVKTYKERE